MDEQKDLPLPQKDLPLPQEDLPLPRQELPAPYDMQLEAPHQEQLPPPHDMLLRAPTLWEKYPIFKWLIPLLIMIGIAIGGFLYTQNIKTANPIEQKPLQIQQTTPTPTPDPTADWNVYTDTTRNFTLKYPATVKLLPAVTATDLPIFFFPEDELPSSAHIGPANLELDIENPSGNINDLEDYVLGSQNTKPVKFNNAIGVRSTNNDIDFPEDYWLYSNFSDEPVIRLTIRNLYNRMEQFEGDKPDPRNNPEKIKVLKKIIETLTFVESSSASSKQVACTEEAKICPDGSSVGRTGPKCEFAACPSQ